MRNSPASSAGSTRQSLINFPTSPEASDWPSGWKARLLAGLGCPSSTTPLIGSGTRATPGPVGRSSWSSLSIAMSGGTGTGAAGGAGEKVAVAVIARPPPTQETTRAALIAEAVIVREAPRMSRPTDSGTTPDGEPPPDRCSAIREIDSASRLAAAPARPVASSVTTTAAIEGANPRLVSRSRSRFLAR